jgi:hypothetical protein
MLEQVQEYVQKLETEKSVTAKDVEEQAARLAEEAKLAGGNGQNDDEEAWEDDDEEMT